MKPSSCGVEVGHTTVFSRAQTCAFMLEKCVSCHLPPCTGSGRVDETTIKVRGVWTCPYRALDGLGQIMGVRLPARRAAEAARGWYPRLALDRSRVAHEGRLCTLRRALGTVFEILQRGGMTLVPTLAPRTDPVATTTQTDGTVLLHRGAGRRLDDAAVSLGLGALHDDVLRACSTLSASRAILGFAVLLVFILYDAVVLLIGRTVLSDRVHSALLVLAYAI